MPLQLPQDVIGFHLRYDFPVESGYLDFRREPLTPAAFVKLCQQRGWEASPEKAAEVNFVRASYRLQRFYRYSLTARKGDDPPRLGVSDGVIAQWSPVDGIGQDLLTRVARAAGRPPDSVSLLHPDVSSLAHQDWVIGRYAVLHDVEKSRASILAYQACDWYLAENREACVR